MGFRVDRTFSGGKISHVSLVPIRPDVHSEFKLTISPKEGIESPRISSFRELVTGQSFEPVTLTESECNISIHDAKMNRVFIVDPANSQMPWLSIKREPERTTFVDITLKNSPIRINNLPTKMFRSENILKFEIEDPAFTFNITLEKGKPLQTLEFSFCLIPDIERGLLVYNLFGRWMDGEILEFITEIIPGNCTISSPTSEEIPSDFPRLSLIYKLYRDLSNIQNILKIRLSIPDKISPKDQRDIRLLSSLLQGKKQKLSEVSATINLITDDPVLLNARNSMDIKGKDFKDFNLFGERLKIPCRIEGSDMQFIDSDSVQRLFDRGVKDLKVLMKSKTDKLFVFFLLEDLQDFERHKT